MLKKSINQLVKTNDSMRFKFKEENGSCVQYENNYEEFDIEIFNFSSEDEIEKKALEMANIPFDFENSFLFKFILFKLPNNSGGFIVTVHHIIGDSWTLGLIAKEVTGIYSAILNNTYEEKDFPSYINYINNENEYINSEKYIKDKAYWDEVFTTIPEVASIPSMKDNKNINHSCKGAREKFIVPEKEISKIKEFCTSNKISVYNFFMAVYSLYLGRVSNLDDFVVGTPILNRTNFEQKHTMGMFISTAPLRINLDHNLSFIDFSKNIASNSMSLLRHQRYPYQAILENLRKKDSNIPNLYNVVLSYQITKTVEEENNIKYSTDWVFNGNCADELQIHLFDLHGEDSITVAYDYKAEKYDSQDIRNLHARILTVINQVIDNNEILLKNIEIVTPEEKHKILYEFNNTSVDYPRDKTIVDLFEEQVEKTPDNIAVVFEDQKLTYKELNEKANQLAAHLIANNVQSGDIIGVCLTKSIELAISIFAVLKCGAVYMPMYTGYPKERLQYMLENSSSKILITNTTYTSLVNSNIKRVLINNVINYTKTSFNKPIINPTDLAYVIYTSGSTGKPKGVKISHRNLINFVFAFKNYFKNINYKDTFFSSTNISFDVCIWEIFTPLLNGAKLVFNTTDIINDIVLFCDNIIKNNITALYIPPNILNDVYAILHRINYDKISKLLVGVEPISNTTLNNYITLNPDIIIINGYGPTETTICATAFNYTQDLSNTHTVSIGKPLLNNNIYILSHKTICPVGIPGELFVSGDGVGMGYLNDVKKTNSAFVQDIFNKENKMYSTGDIAYWNEDGTISFVGRKDKQVKLHGYRIELNEIDYTIETHPVISKSLSIVSNGKIINYFISIESISSNTIKLYLKDKLPFYMIPSFFVNLESFPVTVNGKINTKMLPLPVITENAYIAPRNEIENILCSIWCKLFNKDKISVTDNFFELGGDSLVAIKLQTEALKFNLDINYGNIFNNPTIELLAKQNLNNDNFYTKNITNYDNIQKLININTTANIPETINSYKTNGILLLGATGFLGAHILDNIMQKTSFKVYCVIRSKNGISAHERLLSILYFYFGDKYSSEIGNRIIVLNGDISQSNFNLDTTELKILDTEISTVINSAAHVKHYGKFEQFNASNIEGTQNIIDFCLNFKKKLYHISTISISGTTSIDNSKKQTNFYETDFYINQDLNNAYIYSKFQSELLVFNAINEGLNATILRLGNIFNRYNDGKFQVNFSDNSYLNRLKSFIAIGALPDIFMNHAIDFSPVDFCADAIVKIVLSEHNFTVFHIFNTNLISFENLLSFLNNMGYNIKFTDNTSFKNIIQTLINDYNSKEKISGIIPDLDKNKNLKLIFNVIPKAEFTNAFLNKLGFNWPDINLDYFSNFINYFKNIGFLD